jgi:hypothetical protein
MFQSAKCFVDGNEAYVYMYEEARKLGLSARLSVQYSVSHTAWPSLRYLWTIWIVCRPIAYSHIASLSSAGTLAHKVDPVCSSMSLCVCTFCAGASV